MDFNQAYEECAARMDDLRQQLAAAEQREKVLREALMGIETAIITLSDESALRTCEQIARQALAETEAKP